ncbi:MAG: FAD-dependent oxidoreductase [Alphaproteobacteria bacterium]|jgi:dimethylamine/trimethylamine dehydrogenase|nr:FAD-dependent oxidoreductase [Rhodospirillaceae bacterium]MDG2480985.1 FAD-dependent oxidoreductase [Alphaproteobacteria bacterium]
MARDPNHDVLFEPVKLGPVTAPNRFYQVPHCTGMGYGLPNTVAAMRRIKAAGGWGVVNTEYCSIHPSADDAPYAFCTLWDEDDVATQTLMTDGVHEFGALAGVELWHGGSHSPNRISRMAPLSVSGEPLHLTAPIQSRAMDKSDIRDLRRWQVDAAKRAKRAGFDLVYVYAGHGYLPFQFLSHRHNRRSDEYGGSLENRVRLLREMLEETKEAVGDTMAVAIRLAVDELMGEQGITASGEGREVVEMLAELPDLWNVNVSDVDQDSKSARFSDEGFQEPYTAFVKALTTKPVVGVGRYTSPDRMAGLVRRGVLDLIGAARSSIADPFLPKKIEEGRADEIRECIGCNICRSGNNEGAPIRCTQNPTMGEEWRRGWHPEVIAPKASEAHVLVIGGGPAGLECAHAAGQRGYRVTLAEASTALGGRLNRESALPGLCTWTRVRDWRIGRLHELPNVEIYLDSPLDHDDVAELGADHVVCATGARWRRDGLGAATLFGVDGLDEAHVMIPDDILIDGVEPAGQIVIYDDDHYFMAGALAERLALAGHDITYVTPTARASSWTEMTNEQHFVQARLLEAGVSILANRMLARAQAGAIGLGCIFTGTISEQACDSLILVTARQPEDSLYQALAADGTANLSRIGDCEVPGAIVHAVHAGHRFARELDAVIDPDMPFRRDRVTA